MAFNNVTQSVASAFQTVGQFILDGVQNLLVPDQELINEKIGLIREKFGFVENIKTIFNTVTTNLIEGEPEVPKIEINLGNTEGKYDYGDTAYVLDMTWYLRYKPTVDLIIVAFAYIGFIFLVYKRLPDIISGAGAITHNERGNRE